MPVTPSVDGAVEVHVRQVVVLAFARMIVLDRTARRIALAAPDVTLRQFHLRFLGRLLLILRPFVFLELRHRGLRSDVFDTTRRKSGSSLPTDFTKHAGRQRYAILTETMSPERSSWSPAAHRSSTGSDFVVSSLSAIGLLA